MIIVIGHLVTIPTVLAVSEIATNRRVAGGGAYYIISRSFGTSIGGSIGIALYLSQAISVAFYLVAFAEAFQPVYQWVAATYTVDADPRWVSLPCTVLLAVLMLTKGTDLGVRALWIVSAILGASIWRRRTRNAEALQFDDGGRLPISKQNVTSVPCTTREALEFEVSLRSSKADLVIAGLTEAEIKSGEVEQTLQCYDRANDVLFVNASEPVLIE